MADTPSSSSSLAAHRTGGYEKQYCSGTPCAHLSMIISPSLPCTLITLTSPLHFKSQCWCMRRGLITNALRPRAPQYSISQDSALGCRQGRGAYVDDVQPGKTASRRRHLRGSDIKVASGAEGGWSRARRMTWQDIQGRVKEVPTAKYGICRSPACTTVSRAGRAHASCEPMGHYDQRCVHPVSQFCSEMVLLTSDWPHNHHRLDVLFANLRFHPSGPASSCTHSTCLYTDFLCLLADPLSFEEPASGYPSHRTHWLLVGYQYSDGMFSMLFVPDSSFPDTFLSPCSRIFLLYICGLASYHGQSGWLTCLCLLWVLPLRSPCCCLSPTFPVIVLRCLACLVQ
jgi:hypothetical protein